MAGAVAGGGTALFGLADAVEGGYDIYYGSMGDVDSASINYLKSVVFQGNETAYQITESVFAFTASALVPIGAASKSATLTFRSGAVAVGKLAISDAAGSLTSKVILESTGNRAASMLAGMAASTVTGFGLNALDSKYSMSTGKVSAEATTDLGENGSGASESIKYSPANVCDDISQDVAESFKGATFTKKTLTEDTIMYRVSGGNAETVGHYLSMTPQEGGLQSQLDLALNPAWGNTAETVTKVVVPKGTVVYEGIAAPQNIYDSLGNVIGTLPGGGNQIYIPKVEALWFQ